MSLDGHEKLCGFQKAMFPLNIYGGQDTFSGKIDFLRIWTSNNDPRITGRFYFDFLFQSKGKLKHFQSTAAYQHRIPGNFECETEENLPVHIR